MRHQSAASGRGFQAGVAASCSPATDRARPRVRRVLTLLIGITVLSVADLIITMTHLTAGGMAEANPLARWVIERTGSPVSLASFKLLTVLVCVALLYKVRRHFQAELAAWCALGILACMSVMWFSYSQHLDSPMEVKLAQTESVRSEWVQFE